MEEDITVNSENTAKNNFKDEDGYYTVRLGMLNTFTRTGTFYRVANLNDLIGPESLLGARLNNGILEAEEEHPAGIDKMGEDELINRLITIDGTRVCGHLIEVNFKSTGLTEPGFENYPIYVVTGKIKPSGPYGKYLEERLSNPKQNVALSIRSIVSEGHEGGILIRDIYAISTWDKVGDFGVAKSSQWDNQSVGGVESLKVDGDGFNMCVGASCLPKLEKALKAGTEQNSEVGKIISNIKNRLHSNKQTILDW